MKFTHYSTLTSGLKKKVQLCGNVLSENINAGLLLQDGGVIMGKIVLAGTDKNAGKVELDNRELAREAAAEGFVLLKNDGTLPLKGKKIALFGSGVRMTVKGGTGSGAVRERYSVNIEEGMKNAGFDVTFPATAHIHILAGMMGQRCKDLSPLGKPVRFLQDLI